MKKTLIAAAVMLAATTTAAQAAWYKVPVYEHVKVCKQVSTADSGDILGGAIIGGIIGNNIGNGNGNGAAGAAIGAIIAGTAETKTECHWEKRVYGYRWIWID